VKNSVGGSFTGVAAGIAWFRGGTFTDGFCGGVVKVAGGNSGFNPDCATQILPTEPKSVFGSKCPLVRQTPGADSFTEKNATPISTLTTYSNFAGTITAYSNLETFWF